VIRPCIGVKTRVSIFPTLLGELEQFLAGQPVDKVMVIRDTDRRAPAEVEGELAAKVAGRMFCFPRDVQFCAIRQEIEAWLLADEKAITRVAQSRSIGGRHAPPTPGALEDIIHPKDRLQTVLSKCRLPYDPAVCGEIAAEIDLDCLRYRCPSFRRFEQKLQDC
jgi:hypothetical protein